MLTIQQSFPQEKKLPFYTILTAQILYVRRTFNICISSSMSITVPKPEETIHSSSLTTNAPLRLETAQSRLSLPISISRIFNKVLYYPQKILLIRKWKKEILLLKSDSLLHSLVGVAQSITGLLQKTASPWLQLPCPMQLVRRRKKLALSSPTSRHQHC